MSEIHDTVTNVTVQGGNITVGAPIPPQGTCEFCNNHTYNGYNFLHKLVCENCREKLLKRIQLILKFE
jgi:hypothetical protein